MSIKTPKTPFFVTWSRGDERPVKVESDFLGTYTIEGNSQFFYPLDLVRMLNNGTLTIAAQGEGDE